MREGDAADAAVCATCGRPWSQVEGGRTWLHLEVTRDDGAGGLDFLDVDFCSQDHAADWLREPLPAPTPADPYRMTVRDRLAVTGAGVAFGVVALLAMLGLWTVGRFVIDWW